MSIEMPDSVRTNQKGFMVTTVSTHSARAISMKPCCSPCAESTSPIVEMPSVMSQKPQLPSRKLHSSRPTIRGQTYSAPAMAHTTNVPNTVRCECAMTKSVKWVGCCSERSASTEPWKQPTRYMSEPMIRNLAGRLREKPSQRPIMVPKKFCSTVHTGMISIIDETMAIVSAQSAMGLVEVVVDADERIEEGQRPEADQRQLVAVDRGPDARRAGSSRSARSRPG